MNPTVEGVYRRTKHGLNAIGLEGKQKILPFLHYNWALSYLHLNGHSSK